MGELSVFPFPDLFFFLLLLLFFLGGMVPASSLSQGGSGIYGVRKLRVRVNGGVLMHVRRRKRKISGRKGRSSIRVSTREHVIKRPSLRLPIISDDNFAHQIPFPSLNLSSRYFNLG
jgi:hypothetical protein